MYPQILFVRLIRLKRVFAKQTIETERLLKRVKRLMSILNDTSDGNEGTKVVCKFLINEPKITRKELEAIFIQVVLNVLWGILHWYQLH